MSDSTNNRSGGIGFFSLLGLLFIILKLNPGGNLDTPIKDWSWWLVLLPLYGPLALVLAIVLIGAVIWAVVSFVESSSDKRARKRRAKARSFNNRLR